MAGGNFRSEFHALRRLAAHDGPDVRLADAHDAVGDAVAALLIHFELLAIGGVDDHEAFVPVWLEVCEAGPAF